MGLEDLQLTSGGLEDLQLTSMVLEDLQWVWRTSNNPGGPRLQPSQDLWV